MKRKPDDGDTPRAMPRTWPHRQRSGMSEGGRATSDPAINRSIPAMDDRIRRMPCQEHRRHRSCGGDATTRSLRGRNEVERLGLADVDQAVGVADALRHVLGLAFLDV